MSTAGLPTRPAWRRWGGFSINDVQTGGASDANHIGELNIPVLDGLGPVGGDDNIPE